MKLVFAGTPEVAVPALDALIASGRHEVAAVVTRPDAPAGRGRRLVASPVAERAEEAGHRGAQAGAGRATRTSWPGCGRSRPTAARSSPTARCCPASPSTCPPAAGSTCTSRCCPPGAAPRPCSTRSWPATRSPAPSTFLIEEGLDSGPVYGVVTEEIRPTDTSGDLLTRLAFAGAGLLAATMDGIEDGTLEAVPQPAEGVTARARRSPSRTPASTGRPRRCGSTGSSAAARPRPAPGPSSAASASSSVQVALLPERTDLAPGELAVGKNSRVRRHRLATPWSSVGAAAGQEADARRRLGARRAHRRRASGSAADRGRRVRSRRGRRRASRARTTDAPEHLRS